MIEIGIAIAGFFVLIVAYFLRKRDAQIDHMQSQNEHKFNVFIDKINEIEKNMIHITYLSRDVIKLQELVEEHDKKLKGINNE